MKNILWRWNNKIVDSVLHPGREILYSLLPPPIDYIIRFAHEVGYTMNYCDHPWIFSCLRIVALRIANTWDNHGTKIDNVLPM